MSATEQFIKDAIEGGYEHPKTVKYEDAELALTMLDPRFWQAVGKVRGWDGCSANHGEYWEGKPHWLYEMHRMIDALAEGKSIEEFLQAL